MPDYGHDLLFGCFVPPAPAAVRGPHLARRADEAGLTWFSERPGPPVNPQPSYAWTLLTMIAAATSRVRVFPNVLPSLRPPAMLARECVPYARILSGGRAELGIGRRFLGPIEAMGGPQTFAGDSLARCA